MTPKWQRGRFTIGPYSGRTLWTTGRPYLLEADDCYDQGSGKPVPDEEAFDTNCLDGFGLPLHVAKKAIELLARSPDDFRAHVDPEPLADWLARSD